MRQELSDSPVRTTSIPSSPLGSTTGAGPRSAPPDDRARQLSGASPSTGPRLPQAYLFLTDSVDTYTIADITLSKFDIFGKATTKVDKAGHQFRHFDLLAAQALHLSWDPFLTSPPTPMLSYDCPQILSALLITEPLPSEFLR